MGGVIPQSTRYFLLCLFLQVGTMTNSLFAQSSAFSEISPQSGLSLDQTKVLTFVSNLPHTGAVKYIQWNSQSFGTGNITFTLPNQNAGQPMSFDVIGANFSTSTDYSLVGTSNLGEVSLYVTAQGTGGNISLSNTTFSLYPLGGDKGLMIETLQSSSPEGFSCATSDNSANTQVNYCQGDCGSSVVDVLAMITPAANQWLNNNFGVFGGWFLYNETNNINTALYLSGIQNKNVRVRNINFNPNFPLSGSLNDDKNKLSINSVAQQTLQQSGADVGILLTNQSYEGGFGYGISNSLDPLSINKFCIAEVPFIGGIRYTFAHELAHQFGCMHSNINGPLVDCPHGKNMLNGRNTIMANNAANNSRIQYFSNPSVSFAGEATGDVGTRNNAAQIRAAFCETANNNVANNFSAQINNAQACQNLPFSATASVVSGFLLPLQGGIEQWCEGAYTYKWSWSTNPNFSNPTIVGSNSGNLTLPSPPSCPQFYLRVTVTTTSGCSITQTKLIICSNKACIPGNPGRGVAASGQITPNPAFDQIQIRLEDMPEIVKVVASSASGISNTVLKHSEIESGSFTCDVSNLSQGLWFISVEGVDKSTVLKLVIIR